MMKGGHGPTKWLQDLNWGAFDHTSHAHQLRSCNYYILCTACMCDSAWPACVIVYTGASDYFICGWVPCYILGIMMSATN